MALTKFRKKPVVIDAIQLRWDTWNEMCEHAGVGRLSDGKPEGFWPDGEGVGRIGLYIPTLEGLMTATEGDWIIRGVNGELYSCKPDIFEKTYEPCDMALASVGSDDYVKVPVSEITGFGVVWTHDKKPLEWPIGTILYVDLQSTEQTETAATHDRRCVLHEGCNYLAYEDSVCTKCGQYIPAIPVPAAATDSPQELVRQLRDEADEIAIVYNVLHREYRAAVLLRKAADALEDKRMWELGRQAEQAEMRDTADALEGKR